jgi:hypothetical protein
MARQDGVPMLMRAEPQSAEPQCTVYGVCTAMPTSEWILCAHKAVDDRDPWRLRGAFDDRASASRYTVGIPVGNRFGCLIPFLPSRRGPSGKQSPTCCSSRSIVNQMPYKRAPRNRKG